MDFTKSEQTTGAMNRTNVLPYDGLAYLVDDTGGKFEWPVCQRAEAISGVSYNAVLLNLNRDGSVSVGIPTTRRVSGIARP